MMIRDTVRRPEEERCHQNLPIENELKVKRVYQTEPIDTTSWAYMRALRQFGATRNVYPVNPYVEVYRLRDNVYGLLTENIDGMGDPWMYLILGPEKAMLIDTGFGLGDLKGLCGQLSGGRELIVVNTHGHPDHAGGNAQFDKVYCHELDVPMIARQNPGMWDYLFENSDRQGRGIWSEFDEKDLIPYQDYTLVGCPDGFCFDLGGGYEVELIHMGGHSAGSCAFLDKGGQGLYIGDDLISMRVGVMGGKGSLRTMRDGFAKLAARKGEFAHVYSGHFVTDLENTTVDAMLEACNAICADPVGNASYSMKTHRGVQYFRYVEGLGTIAYSEESV